MKKSKFCPTTSNCWGHRHEVFGLVLVVLATILTIFTCNGLGIAAMFIVGMLLCSYKCMSQHCCHHHEDDCHDEMGSHKVVKHVVKRAKAKSKPKA